MDSVVYFISAVGRIKVGTSTNLEQRLTDIGSHIVEPITLIGTIVGGTDVESLLHRALSDYRVKNEWFADCPGTRRIIEAALAGSLPEEKQEEEPVIETIGSHARLYWLIDRARRRWGRNTCSNVAAYTGSPERTVRAWLACDSKMPAGPALVLLEVLDELDSARRVA